jgi:hypothetical protein
MRTWLKQTPDQMENMTRTTPVSMSLCTVMHIVKMADRMSARDKNLWFWTGYARKLGPSSLEPARSTRGFLT